MKKTFTLFGISLLLVGSFIFSAPITHAATTPTTPPATTPTTPPSTTPGAVTVDPTQCAGGITYVAGQVVCDKGNNTTVSSDGLGATQTVTDPTTHQATITHTDAQGATTQTQGTNCGLDFGCALKNFGDNILTTIAWLLFQVSAVILGFVGLIFNWVVVVTVFQFASYFGNSSGLLIGWGVLRDIGNMVLLFGFIFMGLVMILDLQKYDARHAIPRLLIFAILLNFSLFAAEAVVDVSNVLTSTLYRVAGQTSQQEADCTAVSGSGASDCAQVGISGSILAASKLSGVFNINSNNFKPANAPLVLILLTIFLLITSVVLLSGAVMLIVRGVVLAFILVASPIGFAAMAIPPLEKYARMWWDKLISQAFFAPIYLLLILVSIKIMSTVQLTGSSSFADAVAAPGSSSIGIFIIFAIITGFMIASLMAARSMGAIGSNFVISNSSKLVGAATFGTAGFVGRRTIGAASHTAAKSIRSSSWGRSDIGRYLAGVADKGAKASYDARSTKTLKGATKSLSKMTGATIALGEPGKTAKTGYSGIVKKATDARVDYSKTLTQSQAEKDEEKKIKAEQAGLKERNTQTTKDLDAQIKNQDQTVRDAQAGLQEAQKQHQAAKDRFADAFARGDAPAQREATAMRMEMEGKIAGFETAIKSGTEELNTLRENRAASEKAFNKTIEDQTQRLAQINPQEAYAASLIKGPTIPVYREANQLFTAGPEAREAAAKKIRAGNKSDFDKAIDNIRQIQAKAEAASETDPLKTAA